MSSLNRVELIGFLTEEVNLRTVWSWISVADMNLYVKSVIKNKDWEDQEVWSYHNITLWRWLADISSKYTKKGSQVFIAWRLETTSWDDENGVKKYRTRITADDLILLSPRDWWNAQPSGFMKMTSWVNKADIVWNITQDLDLRSTPNWANVLSFWIATSRKWKNQQTWSYDEKTEFHNIVVWNKMAEDLSQVAKKGSKLFISWRVNTRSWETPEWEKRYTTEVVAESIRLLWFMESWTSNSEPVAETKSSDNSWDLSNAADDIPTVDYSTDIKPEDLPF